MLHVPFPHNKHPVCCSCGGFPAFWSSKPSTCRTQPKIHVQAATHVLLLNPIMTIVQKPLYERCAHHCKRWEDVEFVCTCRPPKVEWRDARESRSLNILCCSDSKAGAHEAMELLCVDDRVGPASRRRPKARKTHHGATMAFRSFHQLHPRGCHR